MLSADEMWYVWSLGNFVRRRRRRRRRRRSREKIGVKYFCGSYMPSRDLDQVEDGLYLNKLL
jgi:hypothetical protein